MTRRRSGVTPYLWNLESAGLVTIKLDGDGRIIAPYQDIYVELKVPHLFGSASELRVKPEYSAETTLAYYGVGSASSDLPPPGASSSYFWYARTHPSVLVDVRVRLVDHVASIAGVRYTQNWLTVPAGSRLAADLTSSDPSVHGFLGPTSPHAVAAFAYGLQWDDRDSDVAPRRGRARRRVPTWTEPAWA